MSDDHPPATFELGTSLPRQRALRTVQWLLMETLSNRDATYSKFYCGLGEGVSRCFRGQFCPETTQQSLDQVLKDSNFGFFVSSASSAFAQIAKISPHPGLGFGVDVLIIALASANFSGIVCDCRSRWSSFATQSFNHPGYVHRSKLRARTTLLSTFGRCQPP